MFKKINCNVYYKNPGLSGQPGLLEMSFPTKAQSFLLAVKWMYQTYVKWMYQTYVNPCEHYLMNPSAIKE
jgi:hypothetical protein